MEKIIFRLILFVCMFSAFAFADFLDTAIAKGVVTDEFDTVAGSSVPVAMGDELDGTWVEGGLGAPNGDYVGAYTLKLGKPIDLHFHAKVDCTAGACGDYSGCAYYFKMKNKDTGTFEDVGNLWTVPGIAEQDVYPDLEKYINENGYAEIMFNFECNMDGKILQFKPVATYATESSGEYTQQETATGEINWVGRIIEFFMGIIRWIQDLIYNMIPRL